MKKITDEEKIEFIEKYVDDVDSIPKEEIEKYRSYVEEGCKKDWPVALHAKAYGCYGGDGIFEEDWFESRDCLLRLAELTDDPFCYNTLGYIYYYGRCNNGIPEYEKAFQCYSIGAAHGIYESQYKLADMFLTGNGCIKSASAGASLILSMYSENRDFFCNRNYECKFADVALRVGGLFENGYGVEKDAELAYQYYLEAKCAIEKRIEFESHYGDKKVLSKIEEALERVKSQLPKEFFEKEVSYPFPVYIGDLLHHSVGMDITLDNKYGEYFLKASGFAGDDAGGCTLLTIPSKSFCGLVDSVTLKFDETTDVSVDEFPYQAFITGIRGEQNSDLYQFVYRNMTLLEIEGNRFYIDSYRVVKDDEETQEQL